MVRELLAENAAFGRMNAKGNVSEGAAELLFKRSALQTLLIDDGLIHQWIDEMDGENVEYFYGLMQDEGGESIKNTLRMQAERTMMKGDVWIPEGMSFL